MICQKQNANGEKVGAKAIELRSKYSPMEVVNAYGPSLQTYAQGAFTSIADAWEQDCPTIGTIIAAYGNITALAFVKAHIIIVNDFIGVKSKLEDDHLDALAAQIVSERYYLNVFEFILFCSRLRSGKYEEFYGSVDPMRIMRSLNEFCKERSRAIAKRMDEQESEARKKAMEEAKRNSVPFEEWKKSLHLAEGEKTNIEKIGADIL